MAGQRSKKNTTKISASGKNKKKTTSTMTRKNRTGHPTYNDRVLSSIFNHLRLHPGTTKASTNVIKSYFDRLNSKHPDRPMSRKHFILAAKHLLEKEKVIVKEGGSYSLPKLVREGLKKARKALGNDSTDDERTGHAYLSQRPTETIPTPFAKQTNTIGMATTNAPSRRKRKSPSLSERSNEIRVEGVATPPKKTKKAVKPLKTSQKNAASKLKPRTKPSTTKKSDAAPSKYNSRKSTNKKKVNIVIPVSNENNSDADDELTDIDELEAEFHKDELEELRRRAAELKVELEKKNNDLTAREEEVLELRKLLEENGDSEEDGAQADLDENPSTDEEENENVCGERGGLTQGYLGYGGNLSDMGGMAMGDFDDSGFNNERDSDLEPQRLTLGELTVVSREKSGSQLFSPAPTYVSAGDQQQEGGQLPEVTSSHSADGGVRIHPPSPPSSSPTRLGHLGRSLKLVRKKSGLLSPDPTSPVQGQQQRQSSLELENFTSPGDEHESGHSTTSPQTIDQLQEELVRARHQVSVFACALAASRLDRPSSPSSQLDPSQINKKDYLGSTLVEKSLQTEPDEGAEAKRKQLEHEKKCLEDEVMELENKLFIAEDKYRSAGDVVKYVQKGVGEVRVENRAKVDLDTNLEADEPLNTLLLDYLKTVEDLQVEKLRSEALKLELIGASALYQELSEFAREQGKDVAALTSEKQGLRSNIKQLKESIKELEEKITSLLRASEETSQAVDAIFATHLLPDPYRPSATDSDPASPPPTILQRLESLSATFETNAKLRDTAESQIKEAFAFVNALINSDSNSPDLAGASAIPVQRTLLGLLGDLKHQMRNLVETQSQSRKEVDGLTEFVEHCKAQLAKLRRLSAASTNDVAGVQTNDSEPETAEEVVEKVMSQMKVLNDEVAGLQAQLAEVTDQQAGSQTQIEAKNVELAKLEQEVSTLKKTASAWMKDGINRLSLDL
ncbi:hypothetical protein T439DRAFT_384356 [Meredithblackwellia eburnea MCA 4105]